MNIEYQKNTPKKSDAWLQDESHNDEELSGLLNEREALYGRALDESKISVHDESIAAHMHEVQQKISARKNRLGIDPLIEP